MELEKVIQEKLNMLVQTGAVDKMIEAHLTKSLNSALGEILREYSDFGRQLKTAIGSKMGLSLDKLNIECYTAMICRVIEDTMNTSALEDSRKKVQKHVTEVLALIEKKHWLLSEIVQKYRDGLSESCLVDVEFKEETYGNYIYLGERTSSGSWKSTTTKAHDLAIHCSKKDNNRVFAITDHGQHVTVFSTKNPNRWEIFMMQLWTNECTIEIDMDYAEAVANREEDY